MPVIVDGKREVKTFESKQDVWDVIDLIVEETNEVNYTEGKDFDVSIAVISQLNLFGCPNHLFDKDIQRDVKKYLYCEKFGIAPYKGSYGQQPANWVDRAFHIKSAIAKKEKRDIDAARSKQNKH